ncbi:MAG: ATP-binding cassette domain-containing protein, partial [Muribaculaceae bacterium]|nr:ATP-binding cassette domain-containing protein [Muribaculaceae bacterium]
MSDIITYEGVEIHRAEKTVLKDVSFSIGEGEFCYLVGRVGSGKSSLLKSMYAEGPIFSGNRAN